jgi:hypothetical protein
MTLTTKATASGVGAGDRVVVANTVPDPIYGGWGKRSAVHSSEHDRRDMWMILERVARPRTQR